jgi:wyosine [tRNA(Phe)-imidazoG37] synthetase (radical SAM superfamily)
MLSILMMVLGLGLIIWSLYSIRKDIESGNLKMTKGLSGVSDRNLEKIIHYLDELEKQMDEMNAAFYDLISELEGNYSVNEKEVSLLNERMEQIENKFTAISSDTRLNYNRSEKPSKAEIKTPSKAKAVQIIEEPVNVVLQTNEEPATVELQTKEESQNPSVLGLSPSEAHMMKQKIFTLRKEGYNLSQIAKNLNIGIGELQLFIKLNTK